MSFSEGMRIPNPPCCAGRAKKSHSRLFGGDHSVIAGSGLSLAHHQGDRTNRWLMSGTTRLRYVHLLSRPCIKAEKAAWGCDFAISLRIFLLDNHSHTLELTYSLIYSWEPITVPRYGLPLRVTFTPDSANLLVTSSKCSPHTVVFLSIDTM